MEQSDLLRRTIEVLEEHESRLRKQLPIPGNSTITPSDQRSFTPKQ
jgi:hypothetical protein